MAIFQRRSKGAKASGGTPARSARAPIGRKRGRLRSIVAHVARVAGRYDAAETNEANRRHWAHADHLSPDAAASASVRATLRARARYEVANNSYAKGIVLTLANDTIGTGPRLQMLTGDAEVNAIIEAAFTRWCKAVDLPEKLRTMRMARAESGEVFGVLTNNRELETPVKLDLRLIEADQVAAPTTAAASDPRNVDGVIFDAFGNPVAYQILRRHPGDTSFGGLGVLGTEFDTVKAENVIHYFRADRPGQSRGLPDIAPALPLFAQLRRYTLAVLAAAETAANFAGILYTDAPANDPDDVDPNVVVELEPRALLTAPAGWRMEQVRAEQPSTTYPDFKRELLNEIARCLNMPFNVAAGNSSGYNFASGKLDHQVYFKSIRVEQEHLGRVVLDRLLDAFLREAVLISDFLPLRVRTVVASGELPPHQWFWDGQSEVDPLKEAGAQALRLKNNTTTLAWEYARQGRDWEAEIRQRAKEVALMEELGLIEDADPMLADDGEDDGEDAAL